VPKEEGEDEEDEGTKQDELDTLAGEDDEDEDEDTGSKASGDGPPPIDDSPGKKKGCSVVDNDAVGFSGVLVLLALGLTTRRLKAA